MRFIIAAVSMMVFGVSGAQGASVSGRVFEHLDYGGGAGVDWDSIASSGRSGRPSARVELFDGTGSYLSAATSAADGTYSFSGLSLGDYAVRVVSSSVTSSRTGYLSTLRAVLTFKTEAVTGSVNGVTDFVGGQDPSVADAGNAGSGWILDTGTGAFSGAGSGTAHAYALVSVGITEPTGVDFGFNFDTVVNVNASGQGSLRQAITNANTLGGDTTLAQDGRTSGVENVVFMIGNGTSGDGLRSDNDEFGGDGVATIAPTSALPTITNDLVIDAQSQPGWVDVPVIELNGTSAGASSSGFTITGGGCEIRGFVINRFGDAGINVTTNGDNTIAGNYIGIDAVGDTGASNGNDGVILDGVTGNTVGGTESRDRNVISGNMDAGNTADAIWINNGSGNFVIGNYLGTNAEGTAAIPNYKGGVTITGSSDNTIGGTSTGAGNLISGNGKSGIIVATGLRNAVLGNSIYANDVLGIDLGDNGVSANNGSKNSGSPNLGMDHPVLTSATLSGTTLALDGYVGSAPNQSTFANARVEFFESDDDPTGFGEGKTYLGYLTSDGSGNFSGSLAGVTLSYGATVTGTATDSNGNTSEFGANFEVDYIPAIIKRAFELDGTPVTSGTIRPKGSVFSFLLYVSNPGGALSDVSLSDVLDPAFEYQSGTIRYDASLSSCSASPCGTAEEAAIFAAVASGTSATDAIDGDPVGVSGTSIYVGNQTVGNGQLDIAADAVWALLFDVRMR
ncbi:MAG: right-handed parallel beta-helix repeat-containing protein [Candidatus Eisenbacteria bacterium]